VVSGGTEPVVLAERFDAAADRGKQMVRADAIGQT
jgi:hypothetical protein